jgi:hypothetical protein
MAAVPVAAALFKVNNLAAVPAAVNAATVVVVLLAKVIVVAAVTVYVLVMSKNVLEPVIVNAPAPPWFKAQLKVEPAPIKVLADALVNDIDPVPVPAVVVNPVGLALLNAVVPDETITKEPPLNVRFLVPAFI